MFDIAGLELIVVAGVALLVLSPKDIPVAMDIIGKLVATVRDFCAQGRHFLDILRYETGVVRMLQEQSEIDAVHACDPLPHALGQRDALSPPAAVEPIVDSIDQAAPRDFIPPS